MEGWGIKISDVSSARRLLVIAMYVCVDKRWRERERGGGGGGYLILDVQRALLFMEEFQGLHMAVSSCIVDSIGSRLRDSKTRLIWLHLNALLF